MMDKANETLAKYNKQITKTILYAFLTLGALVVLFPLFWMILTAF